MLFSIIIPTYNRKNILISTVESVLQQTYARLELIIVDDGSTDDTQGAVQKIEDPRLRYYYKNNEERSIARNFGADKATGDYLIFLDSDDQLMTGHLQQLFNFISSQNERPFFIVSSYLVVNEDGKPLSSLERSDIIHKSELIYGNLLCCSPVTVHSEVFRNYYFNTDPRLIIFEDWELWLRMISHHTLYCVPLPSVKITHHSNRSVITNSPAQLASKINFFAAHAIKNIAVLEKGKDRRLFLGGLYSYGALHIAMFKGNRASAWSFLIKAILNQPSLIFRRRLPAILKYLVLP